MHAVGWALNHTPLVGWWAGQRCACSAFSERSETHHCSGRRPLPRPRRHTQRPGKSHDLVEKMGASTASLV
jgi:hypothetical protein